MYILTLGMFMKLTWDFVAHDVSKLLIFQKIFKIFEKFSK